MSYSTADHQLVYEIQYPFGGPESRKLSDKELDSICDSRQLLLSVSEIEENFTILLHNYIELEETISSLLIGHMITGGADFHRLNADRLLIDRRLMNLLSSCRSYLDRLLRIVKSIFSGEPTEISELIKTINAQYNTLIGYRVMEALRNFVQHCGPPTDSITYGSSRDGENPQFQLKYTLEFHLAPIRLAADQSFKRGVLKELRNAGEKLDLRPLIRQYAEGLGEIHQKAREILRKRTETAESTLEKFMTAEPDVTGAKLHSFRVVKGPDCDGAREIVFITPAFIKYRAKLAKRTGTLKNLSRRYISTNTSGIGG